MKLLKLNFICIINCTISIKNLLKFGLLILKNLNFKNLSSAGKRIAPFLLTGAWDFYVRCVYCVYCVSYVLSCMHCLRCVGWKPRFSDRKITFQWHQTCKTTVSLSERFGCSKMFRQLHNVRCYLYKVHIRCQKIFKNVQSTTTFK